MAAAADKAAEAKAASNEKKKKLVELKPVVPNTTLPEPPVAPVPNHGDKSASGGPSLPNMGSDVGSLGAFGGAGALGVGLGRRRRSGLPTLPSAGGPAQAPLGPARAVGKISIRVGQDHIRELVEGESHRVNATAPLVRPKKDKTAIADPKYAEEIMVSVTICLDVETGELYLKRPSCPQALGFHCNELVATLRDAEGGMRKKKNNAASGEDASVVSFGPLEGEETAAEKYSKYYDSADDWLGVTAHGYYYYPVALE